jgi:hypothetical protein
VVSLEALEARVERLVLERKDEAAEAQTRRIAKCGLAGRRRMGVSPREFRGGSPEGALLAMARRTAAPQRAPSRNR